MDHYTSILRVCDINFVTACKIIAGTGTHEGCDIASAGPVCDADSTTSGIQDSAIGKLAACAGCKKDCEYSKSIMFIYYFYTFSYYFYIL